jgi:phenylacetate-CoA ligase
VSIHHPKIETADRDYLRQIQIERLQATANRAYRHVPYYRDLFDQAGFLPEDIHSLEDLARLPLTRREDLVAHQPYGLFAVPLHDVLRLQPAAGAGGPIVVGYTRNDIANWTQMAERAFVCAGINSTDVILISLDYALDSAAMGAQSGAEALGASVIPCPGLSPERQAEVMRAYRATVLVATPTQALQLGRVVQNLEATALSLRVALIVGEVWSSELRQEIEDALKVEAFASFGLSEMTAPGLATECSEHKGLHLSEDHVLVETVDPQTGQPVAEGELGELVLTTLTREAVPLLRYRTGNLTRLIQDPCPCGRTLLRFALTSERSDDIFLVNGVRVSPHQINEVVHDLVPGADVSMDVIEEEGVEELRISISIGASWTGSEMRDLELTRAHVRLHVFERLGLHARIRLVEPYRRKRACYEDD